MRRYRGILAFVAAISLFSTSGIAGVISFYDEVDPSPDVFLSGTSYDFGHDIAQHGFNPATDTITSSSITLYFFDNGLGTSDSVTVKLAGSVAGTIEDQAGFTLEAFSGSLNIAPSLLQGTGLLTVGILPANSYFQRSVLEAEANRGPSSLPPSGQVTIGVTSLVDPVPDVSLASESYSFTHDIRPMGFDPLTDNIVFAAVTLYLTGNGYGTDDSVRVLFDGSNLGGLVADDEGIFGSQFSRTLGVAPIFLQDDGVLSVTFLPGNIIFDRSFLEVEFLRSVTVPVPATIGLFATGLAGLGFTRRRKQ